MTSAHDTQPFSWVTLTDLACIRIHGQDSASFLQGQLTCDVLALKPGDSSLGAHCDRKGRVFCNFHLLCLSPTDYLMLLPHEMCEPTLKQLQTYVIFAKATLEEHSTHWQLIGHDDALLAPLQAQKITTHIITLPSHKRYISLLPQAVANEMTSQLPASQHTEQDWAQLNLHDKIAMVRPDTSLLFLPQMLGLEELGGISYNKGCYIGQEIVARVHHLGKVKRHLVQLTLNTTAHTIGETIDEPGNNKGTIVECINHTNSSEVLAVVSATSS